MIEITDKTFKAEVEDYRGFILLEFYASWCGKCTKGLKDLEEWGEKTGCKVGKVDLQRNPRLLNEYLSNGLPLYVLFLDGQPRKRKVGITDLATEFKPLKSDFLNAKKGERKMLLKFKDYCHDKHTGEEFKPGDIKEFDAKRAAEILNVKNGKFAEELSQSEALSLKTNDELRKIADELGVSTKGNKADLVSAIIAGTQEAQDDNGNE